MLEQTIMKRNMKLQYASKKKYKSPKDRHFHYEELEFFDQVDVLAHDHY